MATSPKFIMNGRAKFTMHPQNLTANRFDVRCNGSHIGDLVIHHSGYQEWTFVSGYPLPSIATQGRMLRRMRAERQS